VSPQRFPTALVAGVLSVLCVAPSAAQSTPLPDGRVYELVSPAQKSGGVGNVFPLGSLVASPQAGLSLQSSPDGEGIVYEGEDFYEPRLGSVRNHYLSLRGPGSWSAQNLTPGLQAESQNDANLDVGFSPDLSIGIIKSLVSLAEGAPKDYANLYIAQGASLEPLLTAPPPNRATDTLGITNTFGYGTDRGVHEELLFAGGNDGAEAAPAFSHLLFEANDALTPATATAPAAVDGGELENNLYEWTGGGLRLVNVLPNGQTEHGASFGIEYGDEYPGALILPSLSHVISADGARIFWTDEHNGYLYVREDGDRTKLIATGVQFQTASTDGSRVFFTKEEQLHEYNTISETTTDLASSGVQGLLGASDNGAYVYFVSTGVLAGGGEAGKPNLYLVHEGKTRFIATLLPADNEVRGVGTNVVEGDWFRTFAGRTSEVSPSGRYVAFASHKSLTGYDNTDAAVGGRADLELFLYDSATATLACASCNTDGTRPTSETQPPAPQNATYQQRYIDDNGRLFFSTRDPVLAQATNGASRVFEYENGQVYLISPGMAEDDAVFADASESGNDVFFTTRQQLVPADRDQNVDLYDARVAGRAEESAPPSCSREACREPISSPVFQAPVSAAYVGPGNLMPPAPLPPVKLKPKPLTRAQKLAKALRACGAKRNRHRRAACEARARRRF
jgi:hypothetical protein